MSLLRILLAVILMGCAAWAQGQGAASLELLQLTRADDGFRVAYSVKLDLPRAAEDALNKGVPLYFVADVRVARKRWYWRDATVARAERQWRLSYQALTRQYRLSTGGLNQNFSSLTEALDAIRRASAWPVESREEPEAQEVYTLSFGLRLDTRQLPAPLQIGLGSDAEWGVRRERPVHAAELGLAS
ncbi:DUF4390 domain-containing protein [Inhella gelatinilytica]|uniref:DUF4390 domain-containing protein n=1 Tax=Inhella gelatinilytica TaxID=2795030 RepID=A0A931J1L1_9BURK|nr:DUF4390 domain-containing protein [Inhella gelatinilytica]MBH9553681.1 DUF4390 domain-containing protein [Inhella gelatinilytica]